MYKDDHWTYTGINKKAPKRLNAKEINKNKPKVWSTCNGLTLYFSVSSGILRTTLNKVIAAPAMIKTFKTIMIIK